MKTFPFPSLTLSLTWTQYILLFHNQASASFLLPRKIWFSYCLEGLCSTQIFKPLRDQFPLKFLKMYYSVYKYMYVSLWVCVHMHVLMHLWVMMRSVCTTAQLWVTQDNFLESVLLSSFTCVPGIQPSLRGKHFYWLSHLNSPRSVYFNNGFKSLMSWSLRIMNHHELPIQELLPTPLIHSEILRLRENKPVRQYNFPGYKTRQS